MTFDEKMKIATDRFYEFIFDLADELDDEDFCSYFSVFADSCYAASRSGHDITGLMDMLITMSKQAGKDEKDEAEKETLQ
jgi:hypothetical protein